MRKLEGLVKEVVDEMNYLKKREERFTGTNCALNTHLFHSHSDILNSFYKPTSTKFCLVHDYFPRRPGRMADFPSARVFQEKISYRLANTPSVLVHSPAIIIIGSFS